MGGAAFMFDAIAFAGGGNRCYWQGGFYEAAATRLGLAPKLVVGASAGAFAQASNSASKTGCTLCGIKIAITHVLRKK